MSFSNPNVKISYDGNGVDDRFGINFYYLEGDESVIQAELWDYTDVDNPVQQPFVLNVDYTVDATSYPNTEVVTTSPVPVDFKIFVYRSSPQVQSTSFAQGAFPAESIEELFDKMVMHTQEQQEELGRCIQNSLGGTQIDNDDIQAAVALIPRVDQHDIDIAANLSGIGVNSTNIASNVTAISTNAGNIATNAGDIATLQTAVSGIVLPNLVIVSSGPTVSPVNGDIVLVDTTDPLTINLPAPTANHRVRVKIKNDTTGKVINHASGIDGFGANYTITSNYESINLIADGTQWYII